ncbi:MAG: NupC/NupG family nucleoside CNT transporter [Planctomycetota bacterium]|jgi:CNT family concentrative nucleoside transporter
MSPRQKIKPIPSAFLVFPLVVALILLGAAFAHGGQSQAPDEGSGTGVGTGYRLVSFLGIFFMIGVAWLLSANRWAIKWKPVLWGISLQCLFGLIVLSPALSGFFFKVVDGGVKKLLSFSERGADFVMQAVHPHHALHIPRDRANINADPPALRQRASQVGVPEHIVDAVVRWKLERSLLEVPDVDGLILEPAQKTYLNSRLESLNGEKPFLDWSEFAPALDEVRKGIVGLGLPIADEDRLNAEFESCWRGLDGKGGALDSFRESFKEVSPKTEGTLSASIERVEKGAIALKGASGLAPGVLDAVLSARRNKGRLSPTPFGPFDDKVLRRAGFEGTDSLVVKEKFFPGNPMGFYDEFVVGKISPLLKTFTFWILPTIIFFSSLMTVLYHLGVMQWVVRAFAYVMQKTMGTSGAESLSASANIFVGQTEAPLVVKPYIQDMTPSELHAVMVGGFATVAGGVMAAYIGFLRDIPGIAGHLVTASIMSAPAALAISKILMPETGSPATLSGVEIKDDRPDANVIEAATRGATEGMTLTLNVVAMLVAIVGLVALVNFILGAWWALAGCLFIGACIWVARIRSTPSTQNWVMGIGLCVFLAAAMVAVLAGADLSLEKLLGWIFFPFALAMGVPFSEADIVGRLLGEKIVLTEFIAYINLSAVRGELSDRSAIIASYALCGFANFASIGIQSGGIGGIAPGRRADLAKLGLRAMVGGAIAACMTGTIAGILLG